MIPILVLNIIKPKICHCSYPVSFFADFTLSALGPWAVTGKSRWWGRALGSGSSDVVKFSQIFSYLSFQSGARACSQKHQPLTDLGSSKLINTGPS